MCLDGPASTLNDTVYSQPALFVGGLAAVRFTRFARRGCWGRSPTPGASAKAARRSATLRSALPPTPPPSAEGARQPAAPNHGLPPPAFSQVEKVRHDTPALVDSVSCAAGLSLGEYTALVFAGALTFEEGLRVVKVRAESMAAAAKVGAHGMLSIVGLDDATVEECCKEALAKSPEGCGRGAGAGGTRPAGGGELCFRCCLLPPVTEVRGLFLRPLPRILHPFHRTVCQVANLLFPQGRVVSGAAAAQPPPGGLRSRVCCGPSYRAAATQTGHCAAADRPLRRDPHHPRRRQARPRYRAGGGRPQGRHQGRGALRPSREDRIRALLAPTRAGTAFCYRSQQTAPSRSRPAFSPQPLAVSGAFHTARMASAAAALQEALSQVPVKAPRIPVYSNVTGEPFPADGDAIKALLQRQLVSPVLWEKTLKAVIAAGKVKLHELGPGQQVKAMVRRRPAALECDDALPRCALPMLSGCLTGDAARTPPHQVKRVDNKVWQAMQCTPC